MKTHITLFTIFFITLTVFVSCQKKGSSSPAPASSTTGSNIPASNPMFGDFSTSYLTVDYGQGTIYKDSITEAAFFETANPTFTVPYVYAGTVTVNGNVLNYNASDNRYSGNMASGSMSPITWAANGTGTITPFTFSYTPNYPSCNTTLLGMDTCVKANGISITLNNILNQNYHGVEVQVYQGSNSVSRTITGVSGTANFTATDLSTFNVNSAINISVLIFNYNEFDVGSVRYSFRNNFYYLKYSYLK